MDNYEWLIDEQRRQIENLILKNMKDNQVYVYGAMDK